MASLLQRKLSFRLSGTKESKYSSLANSTSEKAGLSDAVADREF